MKGLVDGRGLGGVWDLKIKVLTRHIKRNTSIQGIGATMVKCPWEGKGEREREREREREVEVGEGRGRG